MMPAITVTAPGAVAVAGDLAGIGVKVGAGAYVATRHFGALLQADIRGRARSLFEVTDYDASIGLHFSGLSAEVGTDDPAGFRHELGFIGVDSLGRSYEQGPRPHFGPALDRIGPAYTAAIAALIR